ncbi:hypothetical protein SAMN05444372_108182 [Flavobacterium micromati]|uniref:Uncharacterized protein n=1 Tax=Flavobacterium micromati TaxID=229205 RepID=A0A1M5LSH4_9FLAO|nr:hypothetical protein [Flavobacterium micromati]SHG67936.1 hypothetical protein SAMN05444372_108182 [Flavobacterium micromati]
MIQENIVIFISWYIENKEGKGSNYLLKSFKDDKNLFSNKLFEYADEFNNSFGINLFDINYDEVNDDFINNIQEKLKEKNPRFTEYNKRNGNGIPNAIFGKSNYLRFLNEVQLLLSVQDEVKSNTKLPFRKEFVSFLIEEQGYTVGSARSYASYVVSANKEVLSKYFKFDFLVTLSELLDNQESKNTIKHLELGLTQMLKFKDPKLKSKYKSGFIEYQNFINYEILNVEIFEEEVDFNTFEKEINDTFIPSPLTKEEIEEYKAEAIASEEGNLAVLLDQESIMKNFYFRLTTQNRLYGDIYYPISLIKKIFYLDKENRKYFDALIHNQINKIKII